MASQRTDPPSAAFRTREAKWLGYFDRTHFTALERAIDDQQWRLTACADYQLRENGADQLARWILGR